MTTGGETARSDLIGGAGWIVFGLVVLVGALRMDRFEQMGATLYTMPGFVPALIGALLMLLGGVMVLRGWGRRAVAPATTADAAGAAGERVLNGRVLTMLALSLTYAVGLVGRVPFWLGTALFLAAFTFVYAPRDLPLVRRIVVALASGVITTAVVVLVFEQVFLVRLP